MKPVSIFNALAVFVLNPVPNFSGSKTGFNILSVYGFGFEFGVKFLRDCGIVFENAFNL